MRVASDRKLDESAKPILLIEDSSCDATLLCRMLYEAGLTSPIEWIESGADAIKHLESGELPSLILLDLSLPCMDGHEVLSVIRSRPELAQVPVVVLSGSESESDENSVSAYARVRFRRKAQDLFELEDLAKVLVHSDLAGAI